MKIILNKVTASLMLFGVLLAGCEKQIETTPVTQIDATTALNSREEINASIITMYAIMKSARIYGRDLVALPEALADNGYATNKSGRFLPEYNNTFGAHFTATVWGNSYAAINQINLTLESIPSLQLIPAISASEKASWEGQLYFLRGLYYFELMRVYAYTPGAVVTAQDRGGVVVTPRSFQTIDSARTYFPGRQSIDSVYKYIVADFKRAETNLTNSTGERNLATKGAAQALLSRVYLYAKDYANAKLAADATVASLGINRLTDQSDFVANWRIADHKETIFQIKFASNAENIGVNESLQTSFTTLGTPNMPAVTVGFGDLVPTASLLNALGITLTGGNGFANFSGANAAIASRNTDVRNLMFEPGTTGRGKSYIECTKYLGKNGFPNLDNVPVIRMAEVYLNRAEAFATPGSPIFNEASAIADLKVIKSRRYVGYTGSALETADDLLTGSALYEEILNQRRIELAFEGQRFFDLKRLGRDLVKVISATTTVTIPFTDARILPALPQADVDGNPNLRQNFGY